MSEMKTQRTDASVEDFLQALSPERQADCRALVERMREVTGEEPALWGENIIGFGSYHYRYASGREGDWFLLGFSPRKQNLTLYLSYTLAENTELLEKLGKHTIGKSCLYIKRLSDVDADVLTELFGVSVQQTRELFGETNSF
ncbi:MAG: hypothetical protein OHK0029_05220 [Armatimonadaceae bacterium]